MTEIPDPPKPRCCRCRKRLILLLILAIAAVWYSGFRKIPTLPEEGTSLNNSALTGEPGEGPTLRLATFNIDGGVGIDDHKLNLPRTARAVNDFDLVALQEVHGGGFLDSRDQAQILGETLAKSWLFAPAERRWWRDDFGDGLISGLPVTHWQRFPLSGVHAKSNRQVLIAKVLFHGQVINVINTHLDRHEDHDPELRSVIELFLSLKEPAILMGDLNTFADHPFIKELKKNPAVVDAVAAPGNDYVDWIFVRGMKRLAGGTRDDKASDHPVFWAELSLDNAK